MDRLTTLQEWTNFKHYADGFMQALVSRGYTGPCSPWLLKTISNYQSTNTNLDAAVEECLHIITYAQ